MKLVWMWKRVRGHTFEYCFPFSVFMLSNFNTTLVDGQTYVRSMILILSNCLERRCGRFLKFSPKTLKLFAQERTW